MYYIFFIHSSADGHLGYFHVLAIVNSDAMNIGVCVYFRVMVFSGYMPSSGIAGSYGRFSPSFQRNLHTCAFLNYKIGSYCVHYSILSLSAHLCWYQVAWAAITCRPLNLVAELNGSSCVANMKPHTGVHNKHAALPQQQSFFLTFSSSIYNFQGHCAPSHQYANLKHQVWVFFFLFVFFFSRSWFLASHWLELGQMAVLIQGKMRHLV